MNDQARWSNPTYPSCRNSRRTTWPESKIGAEIGARPGTRDLLLVLSSVSHIDLTAAEALERLFGDLKSRNIVLHLAEVKGPVLDRLRRSGLLGPLIRPPFVSVHAAAQALTTPHSSDKP